MGIENVAKELSAWKLRLTPEQRQEFLPYARALADLASGLSKEDLLYHLRYPATGEVILPAEFDRLSGRLGRTSDALAEHVLGSSVFPLWKRRQFLGEVMRRRHNLLEAEASAHLHGERDEYLAQAVVRTKEALRLSAFSSLFSGTDPVFDIELVNRWFGYLGSWAHFRSPHYAEVREMERQIASNLASNVSDRSVARVLEVLRTRHDFVTEPGNAFRETVVRLILQLEERLAELIADLWDKEEVVQSFWGSHNSWPEKDLILKPATAFHSKPIRNRMAALAQEARQNSVVQGNFLEYVRMLLYAALGNGFDDDQARLLVLDEEWMPMVWEAALSQRIHSRTLGSLLDNRAKLRELLNRPELLPSPRWIRELEPEHSKAWDKASFDPLSSQPADNSGDDHG